MRQLTLILLPLLASCGTARPTTEECNALGKLPAIADRCMSGDLESGTYIGDLACWPFSEPKRMQGLWVIGLETSEFWPGIDDPQQIRVGESKIWFETDLLDANADLMAAAQGKETRIYRVDFEGRSAMCDGVFGHLGIYPREVISQRFYSMRRLQ